MSQAAIPSGGAPHPASAAPSKGDAPSKSDALLEYIQVAAKTMRRTELMYGIMLWLTVLLFFGVTVILIDHWLWEFNKLARFAALAAMIAWSVWWVPRKVLPPLVHHVTPEHAARVIEKQNPEFKDSLISWLQLTREQQHAPVPKGVVSYIGRYAVRNLKEQDASDVVDSATLVRLGAAFFGGLLCTGIYLFASPKSGFTSIARMVAPWANIAPASRVQFVDIQPGTSTVTQGSSLPIAVTVRGMHQGEGVRIQYDLSDGQIVGDTIPMVPEIEGISYKLDFGKSFGGIHQPLRYSILAGDGIAGPFDVSVQVVPLVAVDRIELQFPEYTKLKPRSLLQTGSFEAPEGTHIRLSANANQVMKKARIEFDPVIENKAFVRARETVDMEVEPQALTASWIALLDDAGRNPTTTSYRIKATNELNETNPDPILYSVKVIGDLAPEVFLESGLPAVVEVPINRPREFELRALDPDYGLTQLIALGTQSKSVDVEKKTEVLRNVCFESAEGETGQITEVFVFDPAAYGLRPGDELDFVAIARDNRHDPKTQQPQSNETRTLPLRLRVTAAERFGDSNEESIASDTDARNNDPQSPSKNAPDGKQGGPGEASSKNNPNNVASQPNAPRNNANNTNSSEPNPRSDGAPAPNKNEPSRNQPDRGNRDSSNPQNTKDPTSAQNPSSEDNPSTPENQPNPGSNTQQDPSQRSSKSRSNNASKDPSQKNGSKDPGDASQSGGGASGDEGSDSQKTTGNRSSTSQGKSNSGKGSSSPSQSGNGSTEQSESNSNDTPDGSSENGASSSPASKGGNPQRNPSSDRDSATPNSAGAKSDSNSNDSDPQSNPSASNADSNGQPRNGASGTRNNNGKRSSAANRNDAPSTPPTHDAEVFERIEAFKDEKEKSQSNPDNAASQDNGAQPRNPAQQNKPDAGNNTASNSNSPSQQSANATPNANRNQSNNNANGSSNSDAGSKDSKPSSNASSDRSKSGLDNDSAQTPDQNSTSKTDGNSGRGQSPDGRASDSGTNTKPESNPKSSQDGSSRSPKPDAQGSQQNPSASSNSNPQGEPSKDPSKTGTKPDKAGQNPSGDGNRNGSKEGDDSSSEKPNDAGNTNSNGERSGSENAQGMPKEGSQAGNSQDSTKTDSAQGTPDGQSTKGQSKPEANETSNPQSGNGSDSEKPDRKPTDSGNNQQGNNQQGNNQQGNNQQGNNQQGNNQQSNNQPGQRNSESGKPDGQGNSPANQNPSNSSDQSQSPNGSNSKGSNGENASGAGKSTSKDGSSKESGNKNSTGKENDGQQDGRSGAATGSESASEQTGSQGANPNRANQQGTKTPSNRNPNPPVTSRPETVPPQAKRPGDDAKGNQGSDGGDGGSGKSSSQKPTGAQAQSPGAGLNQTGAPTSPAPPGAAERSQGKEYGGEKANIEYADKTTDLLLDYIDRQRDQPDPELLKRLNWSADDLRKFSDRWRAAKEQARQTPEKQAELEASLRSLGLRRTKDTADRLTDRNDNLRGMQEQGSRLRPPDALREQFEAFRKAAGKLDKSP
ncbi:MAG: hypothetical protein ACK5OB_18385 [Pirellula sp.]